MMISLRRGIPLMSTMARSHGLVAVATRNSTTTTTQEMNSNTQQKRPGKSFASLLRNSPFVHLSAQTNPKVVGSIIKIHDDNLYIDIGTKFHCVCPMPNDDEDGKYVEGGKVCVLVKDFELSARFLGSTTDTTLLEADAILLGPVA
ncbi:small ribosomal subunit protein bS1m-like [Ciona intestinalis]